MRFWTKSGKRTFGKYSVNNIFFIDYAFLCDSSRLGPTTSLQDPNNGNTWDESNNLTSYREQELVQRLEEATDEIEALLNERDELLTLVNGTRMNNKPTRRDDPVNRVQEQFTRCRFSNEKETTAKNETQLMHAILNDTSRSYDGQNESTTSSKYNGLVACFGKKPPLSNVTNFRPSRNGYVSL